MSDVLSSVGLGGDALGGVPTLAARPVPAPHPLMNLALLGLTAYAALLAYKIAKKR